MGNDCRMAVRGLCVSLLGWGRGVIGLLIVLFAVRIPELRLEASADTLVLEGDKALEFYREIGKRFGSQSFLVITYRPLHEDLMSDAVLGRIAALRAELQLSLIHI